MKPQRCHIASVYLTWAIYAAGLAFFVWRGSVILALVWLVSIPAYEWAYIRGFPRISRYLGYGRVDDQQASGVSRVATTVTLYTALGCPFCPLVEQRLEALRNEMGFSLAKQDVTLRPDLVASKGIRAVPVVEAEERRLIGNATTRQLAELILGPGAAGGAVRAQNRAAGRSHP